MAWCVRTAAASVGALVCLGAADCSTSKPPPDCSTHPGYEVVVTAAEGPLPADLKLRLSYDAGCEIYVLATGLSLPCEPGGEVGAMFCTRDGAAADAAALDASAPTTRLTCSVWGAGSGMVTAETAQYPTGPESLGRDADGCDPSTIPVVLSHLDAGGP